MLIWLWVSWRVLSLSLTTAIRFFLLLDEEVSSELFVQIRLILQGGKIPTTHWILAVTHGIGWVLFCVFGITHPKQFIDCLVLVAID